MNDDSVPDHHDDLLVGRTALVTGAAQGMGQAIALRLARSGANLVINDLKDNMLTETEEALTELGSKTMRGVADVTDASAVHEMFATARNVFGSIDILVNNAGVLRPTSFLEISEEEWHWVIGVNLNATFLCTQAAVRNMVEAGWGRVINMSSTAGKSVSTLGGAHYTTSKTAVLGLTRAVAKEVAASGVTVNAICPGLFDTDMTRRTISDEQANDYAQSFPIPRLGLPEEVAEVVAFLASDNAAYMTGTAVDINGGDLMI